MRVHIHKFCAAFMVTCLVGFEVSGTETKPHIIVILADDLGWNDVSFHGSNQIPTPNIDALAYNGVILNSHYSQALCTPSRAAFLTGKYPIHTGMQHLVILEPEPWGLPLNEKIMPQYLKEAGYSTHAIGKWHLGFFRQEYTPTYRGFDTHYGYWNGLQDYYTHDVKATFNANFSGYDMRRNMNVDYSARGKYSTDIFTEEAINLIQEHNNDKPMFMYLSHLAPHTGNRDNPLQAPDEEIAKFAHIPDPERRVYAAMVSMLDRSVGKVITALREKQMLENSIVVFISDNGAPTFGIHSNRGSNYPMRGMKQSPWEGGSRSVALMWSPHLKKTKRVSDQLMHITDWLPTLLTAAGVKTDNELTNIDGIDQWKTISENVTNSRTEMLYNIDDIDNYAAMRRGDFKYVLGTIGNGKLDDWYGETGQGPSYIYDESEVLKSQVATALAGVITARQIQEKRSTEGTKVTSEFSTNLLTKQTISALRDEATLNCVERNDDEISHIKCNPLESPCLFNIREDPCETVNLASTRPLVLMSLENALMKYKRTAVQPNNVPSDPNADPRKWNNTWVPWLDCEDVKTKHISNVPLSNSAIAVLATLCTLFLIVLMILIAISVKSTNKKIGSSNEIFNVGDDALDDPTSVVHVKTDNPVDKFDGFENNELSKQNSMKGVSKNID